VVKKAKKLAPVFKPVLKLDFGCGPHPREGFIGVDRHPFPGVDQVVDLTKTPWPWEDGSVIEAHASHFLEHLDQWQRCAFVNELGRVLTPGGTCQIIVPHWASCRAYGDPSHLWPPVSEFWFYYLSKEWRMQNAPHVDKSIDPRGFDCNLEATWGYSLRQDITLRNQEYQQMAIQNYKEVCQDLIATIKKP
jgi:hypothetical protein